MAKKRQQHKHRDKYQKTERHPKGSGLPKTEHSPKPQNINHRGKRVRSKGKFNSIPERIAYQLEAEKKRRAKR